MKRNLKATLNGIAYAKKLITLSEQKDMMAVGREKKLRGGRGEVKDERMKARKIDFNKIMDLYLGKLLRFTES